MENYSLFFFFLKSASRLRLHIYIFWSKNFYFFDNFQMKQGSIALLLLICSGIVVPSEDLTQASGNETADVYVGQPFRLEVPGLNDESRLVEGVSDPLPSWIHRRNTT